jgi:hypothetical protein
MKSSLRIAAFASAASVFVAVPALAKGPHPTHPTHPSNSHKCTPHSVGFVASGTLQSWGATPDGKGGYNGTVMMTVTRTNHHAAGIGPTHTFTFSGAKVHFGKGGNPPVAGERVKVIGKITEVGKKCSDQTGSGVVTITKVTLHPAKQHK